MAYDHLFTEFSLKLLSLKIPIHALVSSDLHVGEKFSFSFAQVELHMASHFISGFHPPHPQLHHA